MREREHKTIVFIFWTFSGNFNIGLNLTDITFWENIKCVVFFSIFEAVAILNNWQMNTLVNEIYVMKF